MFENHALTGLTNRERQVLELLSAGMSNEEIAKTLMLSVHTVKAHVANILCKLNVRNRICAAVKYVSEINGIPSASSRDF